MIFGYTNSNSFVYNCFIEKEKSKPFWSLKGNEICVQGADVYDMIRDIAFGDSPEELLVWAKVHGFDIASDAETLVE